MGVSTNAYLVFGVPIGSADDGWRSERLEALHDAAEGGGLDYDPVDVWVAKVLWSELAEGDGYEECGLEFFSHCAQEYEMHMLIARELCYTACRGEEMSIPDKLPAVPKPVRRELEKACDELGLAVDTIGWYLVSYWG